MTLLLQCKSLTKSYGARVLFDNVSLSVFERCKLGFIGVNGSGKSTLLKIMARLEVPNEGEVVCRRGLKVGYVAQDAPPLHASLKEILLGDLSDDPREDYEKELIVEVSLKKMGFEDLDIFADTLSGGWRKRLEIARQLLKEPDLLLLDEPTNHLDLESILWLEKFLSSAPFAYVVVSHDRSFLSRVTTSTAELGSCFPEGIFYLDVPYERFVELRTDFLEGQKQREGSLRSKARREEEWLRSNPKARTTKSTARIQEAEELLEELSTIKERNREKRVSIEFFASERETQKLLTAHNLTFSHGPKLLFEKLDFVLSPGSRLGLMGLNGTGKTTLLKILAGELKPMQGTIKYADDLKIVYFDQERFRLPQNSTIRTALATHGDYVRYQGREIHVVGWAQRFLFPSSLIDMPIDKLSGGERARLLIARLMLQPADLLLLDEPTNDLDIPTLEILEESLLEFPGAIVLITHDRTMLSRITDELLELGRGTKPHFYSSFVQWEEKKLETRIEKREPEEKREKEKTKSKRPWKEQKELEELERKIPELELQLKDLHEQLNNADPQILHKLCTQVDKAQAELEFCYNRWHELLEK
jgi:ATP-binding cassette subfamily F protein uup